VIGGDAFSESPAHLAGIIPPCSNAGLVTERLCRHFVLFTLSPSCPHQWRVAEKLVELVPPCAPLLVPLRELYKEGANGSLVLRSTVGKDL